MPIACAHDEIRHNFLMRFVFFVLLGWSASLLAAPKVSEKHAAQMAKGLALFKSDVRLLLKQHCVKCHGGDKIRGDLDLTTRAGLLKGGEEGPSIIPGKADESFLMTVLRHEEEPFMPAKADKLSPDALKKIADWVNFGAPYDQPLVEQSIVGKGMQVTDDDRNFWAYAPL